MVPIQTILVLLTILMMLAGCSQKAPPGSSWVPKGPKPIIFTPIQNDNSGTVRATPTPGGEPPPTKSPYDSFSLTSDDTWTLKIGGTDAETLFKLMATNIISDVDPSGLHVAIKRGRQYECREDLDDKKFLCFFLMKATTGTIDLMRDGKSILAEKAPAEVITKEVDTFKDNPLHFGYINHLYVPTPDTGFCSGNISLLEPAAKNIYQKMTAVTPKEIPFDAAQGQFPWRKKTGTNIECFETDYKAGPGYNCNLMIEYNLGGVQVYLLPPPPKPAPAS